MRQALYGLDFRVGGGDFKVSMQELVGIGAALEKGDVEMGCDIIDFEISYMQSGKHNWLIPTCPPTSSSTGSTSTRRAHAST